MRLSSICERNEIVFQLQKVDVVFPLEKIEVVFQIRSYYISVCLLGQVLLISRNFTTSPDGRADAGYIKNKTNLSLQAKLDLKLRLSLAKMEAKDHGQSTVFVHNKP
jgi:hypothetical protein